MTPNRRIFLNIAATYGRSLFALLCGLFGSRWVLMALGQEDFGLYGVVGGLVAFIGIVNTLLTASVSRFYAVSVGAADAAADKAAALQDCRAWFSTTVLIHTVIPLVLTAIGEPLGEYAIHHGWIAVPSDRVETCTWVFRFACISSLIGMMSVPFSAMYTAKQYIAELTIYGFITSAANVCFFYYMASHPSVWLAKYAAWAAGISIAPTVIIAVRAYFIFPECRLNLRAMWDGNRVRELLSFAGWQAFGGFGSILRSQGVAILLNRHVEFGPARNSSMTIANQVAAQTETLASAMVGAFQPAIANAYGAADYDRMRALASRASKFGTLLSAVFILPLALELPEVLRVWLKEPPAYAVGLCWCALAWHLIDRTTVGQMLAVSATGRIAVYQAFLGTSLMLTLPVAWLFVYLNWGIYSVGWAMIATMVVCAWGRVWFARSIAGMSGRIWLRSVIVPLFSLFAFVLALGCLPRLILPSGIFRVGVTTLVCEATLALFSWKFVLTVPERTFVARKIVQLKEMLWR